MPRRSVYRCAECGHEHPKWAGRCEACGADIPHRRLDALPYARYCVRDAERLENRPGP